MTDESQRIEDSWMLSFGSDVDEEINRLRSMSAREIYNLITLAVQELQTRELVRAS